jgi:hypothetical protein
MVVVAVTVGRVIRRRGGGGVVAHAEEERNRSNEMAASAGSVHRGSKLRNSVLLQKNNLCISGLGYDLTCSVHCFLWEVNGMEWLLERSVR